MGSEARGWGMQGEGGGGEDDFAALLPTRVRAGAAGSGEPSPTRAVRAGGATTATQAAPANNVERRVVVHFGGNTSAPSGRTAAEPNAVRTTRYTALTFVFRNLYEQFSARLSYFYFLALILINQLPVLAVFGRLVSMVPLLTVVVATAAKDIFEDARRRAADRSANARKVEVIACGTGGAERWGEGAQARATSVEWKSIAAGTLVVVREGHEAPADLVLLGCGGADAHVAHVDTAALDGENALKRRVAARPASIGAAAAARAQTSGPEDCAGALRGRVECDAPNGDLDTFRGELHIEGEGQVKVTPVNTMLRGSVLRMTPWVIGVAVYVGHEAKVMMASTPPPSKRTLLERRVNVHMMLLGALLATICTIGAVGAYQSLEMVPAERMPWFGAEYQYDGKINFAVVTWFGLLILYQVLVPIALFIGMEIVRLVQAYLMATDVQLYEESRDQPCVVRTLTVNEDLGCVGVLLADKTGTLTANNMSLHALCTTDGEWQAESTAEGGPCDGSEDAQPAPEHVLGGAAENVMILCNSVVPPAVTSGSATGAEGAFQGESPDEVAMVEWLDGRGVVLRRPGIGVATVSRVEQEDSRYAVLGEHAFDSERRRMSVIVRRAGRERTVKGSSDADVHAELLMKGADEAVLPLAVDAGESGRSSMSRQAASDAVLRFARMGLRTLVLARRQLSIEQTQEWAELHARASNAADEKEASGLEDLAERAAIGAGVEIVGVVGIKDELQRGTPETVRSLKAAGVRVWMLTGDKVETAVAVAKTAALLDADDECSAAEPTRLESFSTSEGAVTALRAAARAGEAVVIAGHVLAQIIGDEHGADALAAAVERCPTAVVCRASPLQKAAVASIARGAAAAVSCTCLAIGDGANDVGMLRVAHVGVGIAGAEGRRAAMSADIALGAFSALGPLLLVHGHWSYARMAHLALYVFYRSAVIVFVLFFYSFYTNYSTMSCIDQWNLIFYTLFYTAWPTVVVAFTDQDVPRDALLAEPALYTLGRNREIYSHELFVLMLIDSFWQAAAVFFVTVYALRGGGGSVGGLDGDAPTGVSMGELGDAQLAALVLIGNATLLMDVRYLTWPAAATFAGSVLFAILWQIARASYVPAPWWDGWAHSAASARWWLAVLAACVAALGPRFAAKALRSELAPSDAQLAREATIRRGHVHEHQLVPTNGHELESRARPEARPAPTEIL